MGLNDEVFFVLKGTTTFLISDAWVDADKGTFLRIPAKAIHEIEISIGMSTGVHIFFIQGGF